jgi:hypothetical protein
MLGEDEWGSGVDGFAIRYGPQGHEARLTVTSLDGGSWRITCSLPGRPDVFVGFDCEEDVRQEITRLLAGSMEPTIDLDAPPRH